MGAPAKLIVIVTDAEPSDPSGLAEALMDQLDVETAPDARAVVSCAPDLPVRKEPPVAYLTARALKAAVGYGWGEDGLDLEAMEVHSFLIETPERLAGWLASVPSA